MKNRIVYFDYLRVFSIFAVIFLHVASQNWYGANVKSLEWQVFNVYDSIVRWAVPVLVMISGALFLGNETSIKKIYSKKIPRLITAFLFWGVIYAITTESDFLSIVYDTFYGHYHLWFIPMIIGLYICTPIIQQIIKSEKVTNYFLILFFIFAIFLPQLMQILRDFGGEIGSILVSLYDKAFGDMHFHLVLGYAGYFITGYYLNKSDLSKRSQYLIYAFGVLGGILTILLTVLISAKMYTPTENYYGHFNVNVLLESIAVFVWFKYHVSGTKANKIMHKLAQYSFGAYLVHVLFMDLLNAPIGLNTLSFHPIISVPVISIIIFVLSYLVSGIINKIPFLRIIC